MKKDYPVAIVIPTLNEEKHIDACLRSVKEQSYPFAEMDIMVVDGGSTDRTCAIVEEWGKEYPNVRLLPNPKRIQAVAFNIGVASSDAPVIIRLDAHAWYHTRYIELCYQHLQANPHYGNVGGVWQIEAQNDSLMAKANALLNQSKFGIGGAGFRVGAPAGEVETVPFGAFPRKVIEQIGGMNEALARGEDNEFNGRIRKAGYAIYLDPEIVSTYYARPDFCSSVKQMYSNGRSIGQLFHIDREGISVRHIVPLLFVLGLIGGAVLAPVTPLFRFLYHSMVGLYLIVNLCATAQICAKQGIRYALVLPILFFSVHVAYGIGTIVGLITKK